MVPFMNRLHPRPVVVAAFALALALGVSACSSSDDSGDSPKPKAEKPVALSILVTNDDGYSAGGIDALVNELATLPEVTVTVVAPEENQSGSGTKTTPGPLQATSQSTESGTPVTAVDGFPADSVNYALDEVVEETPDLVVSGVNEGQNVSVLSEISGTVGAAREAAGRGIPAIAVSSGLGTPPEGAEPDYAAAAEIVTEWIQRHREELADGGAPIVVLNVNAPTCATGTLRGVKQVPLAPTTDGLEFISIDCTSSVEDPANDIAAFNAGFASVTTLEPDGVETTATTRWASE